MGHAKGQVAAQPGRTRPWLTANDVAEQLCIDPMTVRAWAREGRLAHARFGPQTVRFRQTDVDAYIEAHYVAAGVGA